MAVKFVPNAVMLYREGGKDLIEGKLVECQVFDQDNLMVFEEARADGWKTYAETFLDTPKPVRKKGA